MSRPAGIPDVQWRDCVWQMQERVRSGKDLERYVNPTDDERQAIAALAERFRFVITPYYASLMDTGTTPPARSTRQVVPRTVLTPGLSAVRRRAEALAPVAAVVGQDEPVIERERRG